MEIKWHTEELSVPTRFQRAGRKKSSGQTVSPQGVSLCCHTTSFFFFFFWCVCQKSNSWPHLPGRHCAPELHPWPLPFLLKSNVWTIWKDYFKRGGNAVLCEDTGSIPSNTHTCTHACIHKNWPKGLVLPSLIVHMSLMPKKVKQLANQKGFFCRSNNLWGRK